MWVQETCNDASCPSEAAACFFNASIELTRASISEFFAAKASAMSDSILVAALLDTDKSSCSCFIRASYELLRSLWKGGRWTSKYYNIVPTLDYFYKWRHWAHKEASKETWGHISPQKQVVLPAVNFLICILEDEMKGQHKPEHW